MPQKNNNWRDRYLEWRKTANGEAVHQEALALIAKIREKGFTHYSMQTIVCVIRHHRAVKRGPEDEYKINNNYVSFLARELIVSGAVPEGFLQIRD